MDARIEGQLAGVVHTVPTRGSGPSLDSRAQAPGALKRNSNADSPADLPDLDFDANGDGAIEHWSFAHGGDSFATFKPPPGGAAGSNLRRVSHAPAAGSAPHSAPHANAHATTAAAIHHAREAYQRDGGATGAPFTAKSASSAPADTTPTTAVPEPSPPAPLVTQSPPAAALPSARS